MNNDHPALMILDISVLITALFFMGYGALLFYFAWAGLGGLPERAMFEGAGVVILVYLIFSTYLYARYGGTTRKRDADVKAEAE